MANRNLFSVMKGMFGAKPTQPAVAEAPRRAPRGPAPVMAPPSHRGPDPDLMNPATITHTGRAPDGREMIMTMSLGSFLLDREMPSICYFRNGNVAEIPTIELRHLFGCLMEKRHIGDFALHYVDLLNVASFELQARSGRLKRAPAAGAGSAATKPQPLPRKPMARSSMPAWPDAENPATITRVGRFQGGSELVMTLGLGTFVMYRDPANLKYFDRGREWDVPDGEIGVLIDALTSKQDMKEHAYTYSELLSIATVMRESRRARRR